ncbi:MAG: tRNA preQ1(34) S-adenosylmethionine ribosyltransferase-isomerase QueA [Verrucomicrobiales bacterium]|nr:tRNA preQ1(34) S-adenosylmethionine ribosyltransferase-isomerase QueA [Verrucomicrobiales bacterium]
MTLRRKITILSQMRTADFDFSLPPELIAQKPAPNRDQSRLLHLNRQNNAISHLHFPDLLTFFRPGDVLVLNNSRVIPARLRGVNVNTGGNFELLLLEEGSVNDWWAMLRPGKRGTPGTKIRLLNHERVPTNIFCEVLELNSEGHRRLKFSGTENILNELDAIGEIPLPPYIERDKPRAEDLERYQTVYAQTAGSVAAPTAGLHFTENILAEIKKRGVKICYVTLHVGLGTFLPVKAENISEHIMHEERFSISSETAEIINLAKAEQRRVFAVGTTSVRTLESAAEKNNGLIVAGNGTTHIFIYPPRQFKIVDALVTNFHLPCSTLLMLISAFASPGETRGREIISSAYQEAIRERYRFFSYGDAMLIL